MSSRRDRVSRSNFDKVPIGGRRRRLLFLGRRSPQPARSSSDEEIVPVFDPWPEPSLPTSMRRRGPVRARSPAGVGHVGAGAGGGAQHDERRTTVCRRQWRNHAAVGILRDGLCRPHRPCPANGRGAQRGSLRQHLERPLLSQRHAAAGRLPDRVARHDRQRPRRSGRPLRSGPRQRQRGGNRNRALRGRALRRDERPHRPLRAPRQWHRAERCARRDRLRAAADRRSSDAPAQNRRAGCALCGRRLGNQRLPGRKPNAGLARHPAVHGARDAGRHVALRRQTNRAALLARRALRHRPAQRRRHRIRLGGAHPCNPARPRPAAGELAAPLHAATGRQ